MLMTAVPVVNPGQDSQAATKTEKVSIMVGKTKTAKVYFGLKNVTDFNKVPFRYTYKGFYARQVSLVSNSNKKAVKVTQTKVKGYLTSSFCKIKMKGIKAGKSTITLKVKGCMATTYPDEAKVLKGKNTITKSIKLKVTVKDAPTPNVSKKEFKFKIGKNELYNPDIHDLLDLDIDNLGFARKTFEVTNESNVKSVSWKSSDEKIAILRDGQYENEYYVLPTGFGNATITVTIKTKTPVRGKSTFSYPLSVEVIEKTE